MTKKNRNQGTHQGHSCYLPLCSHLAAFIMARMFFLSNLLHYVSQNRYNLGPEMLFCEPFADLVHESLSS